MKLGKLEIRRAGGSTPQGRDSMNPGVVGADHDNTTGWYGWMRSDDPNPLFHGRRRFDVYDEMRKSDPSIRAALWMVKLPMRAATWTFDTPKGSTDPMDILVADACSWLFGVEDRPAFLSSTWDETLSQALLMLDFGCMFEEIIWSPDAATFTDDDGDEHALFAPSRLAPRYPRTVEEIDSDPLTGRVNHFRQWLPNAKEIPPAKLVVHILDKEADLFGTSLLRPMYAPWKLKKELQISTGIGWDRFSSGLPVAYYTDPGSRRQAERIARDVRSHERAYAALEEGQIRLEILDGSGTLPDPTTLLKFYDEQIAQAAMQQFSSLGKTSSGNRALGEVLVEPFYQAVQAIAGQIAAVLTRDVVRRFVDVNFGTNVDTPTLSASRIAVQNVATLTAAISDLHSAGFSFDDVETQDDIRALLELRALPDDFEPPKTPAPGEGQPPQFVLPPAAPPPAVDPAASTPAA